MTILDTASQKLLSFEPQTLPSLDHKKCAFSPMQFHFFFATLILRQSNTVTKLGLVVN